MLRGVLGLCLVLSLAGKAAWSAQAPQPSEREAAVAVARMLRQEGFAVRLVERSRAPHVVVAASRSGCELIAGDYPPHGTFQDVYRTAGDRLGTLRFVHRGRVTVEEPKVRGLLDFYLWREQRRIGIDAARAPVIVVAASPGCRLEDLTWSRAASLAG